MTRLLLEAAEDAGIPRAQLFEPLGLTEDALVNPSLKVEWTTVTRVLQQLSLLLGDDATRLRDIGRRMSEAPSYTTLRRIAGAVVSVTTLYDIANRFVAPANFPHLVLQAEFAGRRMRLHGEIPTAYAPSKVLFQVFEGSLLELPTLIGLPAATFVESRVTPRTIDAIVELPRSRSLVDRAQRAAHVLRGAADALTALEEHQLELSENVVALQGARHELGELLDRLPDLVLVRASDRILWGNSALLTALGYELLDLVGRPLADVLDDDAAKVGHALDTLSRPSTLTEIALRARSGGQVVVEGAPTQEVVFDGVAARLLVARDVTERKQMRQTLIVADRLASVGLLAAGVAHEVNNPLGYILNNIEIARRELSALGPAADTSRHALAVALDGVDRIRSIVRDLLLLASGDDRALRAVDVSEIARSTLALAAVDIDRTAKLVVELEPGVTVDGTAGRIGQILLNLVTNALQAMCDGDRAENVLTVRVTRASDGRVSLEVSDTGCGIDDADLPRLFASTMFGSPSRRVAGHFVGADTAPGRSLPQRQTPRLQQG